MTHPHPEVLHNSRPHPEGDARQDEVHWHCPSCRLPSYTCRCTTPPVPRKWVGQADEPDGYCPACRKDHPMPKIEHSGPPRWLPHTGPVCAEHGCAS